MIRSSADYFDALGGDWERLREGFFSETVRERAIDAAAVEAGRLAADIGAGTGFVTRGLVRRGVKVIAVDRSHSMLDVLRCRFTPEDAVDCRAGEAERLPIEDDAVDDSFANMLLHHVENPRRAIEEMVRIVRPGGRVVVTDLDRHDQQFLKTEHYDLWMGFDRDQIRRWFEQAGLCEIQIEDVGEECCADSCEGRSATVGIFLAVGRYRGATFL